MSPSSRTIMVYLDACSSSQLLVSKLSVPLSRKLGKGARACCLAWQIASNPFGMPSVPISGIASLLKTALVILILTIMIIIAIMIVIPSLSLLSIINFPGCYCCYGR